MSRSRALWLIAPWAIGIVMAIGWVAYWHVVAASAETRLRAWLDSQPAAGAEASVGRIERAGFPALLRFDLTDARYATARGGWSASTPRLQLHVDLLNPQHVIFKAGAPVRIERNGGAVTDISADALIASLRTAGGRLAVAGVEADNMRLDDPAKPGVLSVAKLVANLREDPRAQGDYQLALDMQTLVLPRDVRSFEAFGRDVAQVRAAIVIGEGGELLAPAPNDPLGVWRARGGRLRFDAIAVNWGPLEATAQGEGGLDEQHRLDGRLEVPIERPAPVLTAIANGPDVDGDARRALALLAAGFAISGDDVELNVEARDGVLRIEGIPVRMLPPAY